MSKATYIQSGDSIENCHYFVVLQPGQFREREIKKNMCSNSNRYAELVWTLDSRQLLKEVNMQRNVWIL